MDVARHKARFDWLVELGGATAFGLAAGYAAFKAAPSLVLPLPAAMTAGGLACFGLGMIAMRSVKPAPREHVLPPFAVDPVEAGELLLDQLCEEPLLLDCVYQDDALLLDDPLVEAQPDSRVVRLFASPPAPTPGQLKERIDRHLADAPRPAEPQMPPPPDAAKALYAALSDLKRSLR